MRYLLDFLERYDFGSGEEYEADTLINASVLGNVFERINAYKDGSFYTPSAITSYMCEENLEQVILCKFNEANPKWQCKSISDIESEINREIRLARNAPNSSLRGSEATEAIHKDKIDCHESAKTDSRNDSTKEIKSKYIKLLQSIRICDPAVGSGHFLVAALNQMLKIYYDLGLLSNEILQNKLKIIGDELYLSDFAYTKPRDEAQTNHKIQKELFELKKSIIENNLFGVDINPNSVEICKLRLWIELLKNSYYLLPNDKGYTQNLDSHIHQMQTLPNIDINIKCGNSLISNIALNISKDKLEAQLKNLLSKGGTLSESGDEYYKTNALEIKAILHDLQVKLPIEIDKYKKATNDYKDEKDNDLRALIKNNINSAKGFILNLFVKTHPTYREFKSTFASYLKTYGYDGVDNAKLPNTDKKELDECIEKLNDYSINAFEFHKTLDFPKKDDQDKFVEKEFIALVESMKSYEAIKTQASEYFEWRFEFPEVLDSNGDFVGFDLIIGNPPYIKGQNIPNKEAISKSYIGFACGGADIYTYFFAKGFELLKQKGILSYIVSNKFTKASYGQNLRNLILQNQILFYVDCDGVKIFDNASVDSCIISHIKD